MDWSTITSGGQLTQKILEQAASTRENAYAFLYLIRKFNDPFKIEVPLIRFFILMAGQDWSEGRITIEIVFKDANLRGCPSDNCVISLLTPLSSSSQALLKRVTVKASHRAFRDALRDRRKLSPYMLEDQHIGKFILIAGRSLSLPPPGGAEQAKQKLEARLAKIGYKPRSMPPEMRQGLEEMKRGAPPRTGPSKPPAKNAPRQTAAQIPKPAPLPSDFVYLEQGWNEEESPTLRKPRK